ncbi:pentapeptide repeat-containing protein [Streptomyces solisilvae]|uniref:pentapeptide repeat-containing protein n=1 Tax=Streptomyces malaysiensis TaxID=92644 RepID=UPI00321FA68E|nr:hypothetical protein [Streptomyces malaysiensis]
MSLRRTADWAACVESNECQGVQISDQGRCWAHLDSTELPRKLANLHPGTNIDLRGVEVTQGLWSRIRERIIDADGRPHLGVARLEAAVIHGGVQLRNITFEYPTFHLTSFIGEADFCGSIFMNGVSFNSARFERYANFSSSTFRTLTEFENVVFGESVSFYEASFRCRTSFRNANFEGLLSLTGASFLDNVSFFRASFSQFEGSLPGLGPFACAGSIDFREAKFRESVRISAVAPYVDFERASFTGTATIQLRYATVSLSDVSLNQPFALVSEPHPFPYLSDDGIYGDDERIRLTSIEGVDATFLSLASIDLSDCKFTGSYHLDLISLEGQCSFSSPPIGWIRESGQILPLRWTRRSILAEEREWRSRRRYPAGMRRHGSWVTSSGSAWSSSPSSPDHLAVTYRMLRKSFEDSKDEPGAADFYYGEMEMRRNSQIISRGERWLLHAYWVLSGYGLRASRALGWLTISMIATILLMTAYGIPKESPRQEILREKVNGAWKTVIEKTDPENPTERRFTGKRLEKSLSVTLNSVIFRSSGQDLTTAGTYIEMASRFSEPVLLGLGALAIRSRVKRGS